MSCGMGLERRAGESFLVRVTKDGNELEIVDVDSKVCESEFSVTWYKRSHDEIPSPLAVAK